MAVWNIQVREQCLNWDSMKDFINVLFWQIFKWEEIQQAVLAGNDTFLQKTPLKTEKES